MIRLIVLSALVALVYGRAPYIRSLTPTLDGRIVGGAATTIEAHPYQVSFQVGEQHHCGGSLVAPKVVVTAAHCTEGLSSSLSELTVRAGSALHNTGGTVIKVASIHDHPKYDPFNSYDYDCSVLVLETPFTVGTTIKVILLQDENANVPAATPGTVTGWGALTSGGSLPETLQAVDVPIVEQDTCQNNYPREKISDRMHCFGVPEGGKDACQGDSGGPLVVDEKLVGIVSWGYGCAFENLPSVYVKIADKEIRDHINEVIAGAA